MVGTSGAASFRRLAVPFGIGCLLGLTPFLFLEPLTYLIPLTLRDGLRAATVLLGGFIALIVLAGEPWGRRGRKLLQAWAFLALLGLVGLFIFQNRFIVRFKIHSGLTASEVIGRQPRLKTCPPRCKPEMSDRVCLESLGLDALDLCWDESLRRRNLSAWAVAYLLVAGGAHSFVGLLWSGVSRMKKAWPVTGGSYDLFLSYSRQDRDLAKRLARDLKARDLKVWWDRWEMEVGDSLPRKIAEAVSRSACFAIILSPDAVDSPWVQKELDFALAMEMEGGLTILPILYRPCELPPVLRVQVVWADFTSSYQEGLDSLLRGLGARRSQPPSIRAG